MGKIMKTLEINGVVYEIVDAFARDEISTLQSNVNTANSNIKTLQEAAESARADINNIKSTAIALDTSLSKSGYAADAKATGDEISQLEAGLNTTNSNVTSLSNSLTGISNSYVKSVGGKTGAVTLTGGTGISVNGTTITNTGIVSLQNGTGISVSGSTITNTGVTQVASGTTNGTISVTTNGKAANVAVKGLGSAAYTSSDAYMPKFTFDLIKNDATGEYTLEITTEE